MSEMDAVWKKSSALVFFWHFMGGDAIVCSSKASSVDETMTVGLSLTSTFSLQVACSLITACLEKKNLQVSYKYIINWLC